MNQQSYDANRPKSRPYDYDSALGQSKPAPSPEFEEIFRRAKQHQQQTRPQQNKTPTADEPTRPYNPLPFPSAPKRTKPIHLENNQTPLERDTTAAVLEMSSGGMGPTTLPTHPVLLTAVLPRKM